MQFHEKLKCARKRKGWTQVATASAVGVSLRTYKYYESGQVLPRTQDGYVAVAKALDLTPEFLYTMREEFLDQATEKYGETARIEANELLTRINGLFAGGKLSDEDKDEVMFAMKEMFFDAKERTKTK